MAEYVRLSTLVGSNFRVESVLGYQYKRWDPKEGKMLVSDRWQEGYRKLYQVVTNKGQLDLGSGQIGSLLEAVFKKGIANINGVTFQVKSNGKQGMDIRYFFNPVQDEEPEQLPVIQLDEVNEDIGDEPINLDDIPF